MRLIKLLIKFLKPENVDLNSIRCVLEDNRLTVVANVSSGFQKKVPIEFIQKEKMTQGAKEQQSQEIQSKESQMNLPEKEGPLKEPCPSCFQKSVPIESKGSEIMTEHENEEKNRESQTNIPEQKGLLKEQIRSGYQRNVPIESMERERMTERDLEQQSRESKIHKPQVNIPEQKSSSKESYLPSYQRNVPIESMRSEQMTEQKSKCKHENEEKNRESPTNIPEQKSSSKESYLPSYQRNVPIESTRSEQMTEQKSHLKEPCPTCKSPTIKRG